ncbi:MAG: tRNA dihydrouridine synthase DusB [Candidatus Krumholzibacteriaceae bacterium]|jgi:nifR3 family TIM-barrel protein
MPVPLGKSFFEAPLLCLAPMAGYSDAPLRLVSAELGADVAFTGLVSADGLARGVKKSEALLRRLDGEAPLGVQLFGATPETLAGASSIAESAGASFIDLNFGCPVKKVVRKNGGAAIMRDLDLMERISRAVVAAVAVPVTAKIRSGWSVEERNFLEAGLLLERCGIAAVTLHPRQRSQGFTGAAHWEDIARLREALSIPVIANGDIKSVEGYREVTRATGAASVMIGRGALGNPWIFREIKDCMRGAPPREATLAERLDVLERHVSLQVAYFGEQVGVREMRKFYRWYLRSLEGAGYYRAVLTTAGTCREVLGIVLRMREELKENGRDEAQKAS